MTFTRIATVALVAAAAASLSACDASGWGDVAPAADPSTALPDGHPPVPDNVMTAQGVPETVGVVLESRDGGGYTYARLASAGSEIWTAGPPASLEVGDTVALYDAVPMENFPSASLERTFDVLYFVGAYQKVGTEGGSTGGEVLQVLSGGGYTYVEVDQSGASLWLAAPQVEVGQGNTVVWKGGSMMRDFSARSLDRTFEEILFVGELSVMH